MSLATYYRTMFDVTQYHKFTLTELENMIPYERDLYIEFLADKVKQEKEMQRQRR